ncbi:MAG: hypothetical protein M4D80_38845 [Myxococcota bacterium]|nr:hypothetical protein [Deltaproteobacteria bacterium]MDQ3341149.1 hypothetical protein [Myxococcota bacterium]
MTKRLLLVCLALSACNTNNGGDGDDAPPIDGNNNPNPTPVTPRVGAWDYDSVTPVSNTCPGNLQNGGIGAFAIDQSSTSSFHVIPNDGTAAFTCTLNGSAFDCPDRAAAMQDLRPQLDAVITMRAIARGTFSTSTRASGRQEATATCAGTQCNATGVTFPCMAKVDFVIQAR